MMKAGILGFTGYTGLVLFRLLVDHPDVTGIIPISSSRAGESILDVDKGLAPASLDKVVTDGGKLVTPEEGRDLKPDVVFAALPHVESAKMCARFADSCVVIDLSADFRFRDARVFERVYGAHHPEPGLLARSIYGLTEWNREGIATSDIIANPGCYPTATLLPLLPLLAEKLGGGRAVVNAISGISGAGRKVQAQYLFCERTENAGAYSPGTTHRHMPEIEAGMKEADGSASLLFTPHLAPVKRGMTVTTVLPLARKTSEAEIGAIFANRYGESPFVRIVPGIPQSRDVWGSNRCDIGFRLEDGAVMLFSAIDNLIKGASGQAVQNMNVRFGFDEKAGLRLNGEF
jgi:N-acetyl-gamma-glutamyl-phosphate reductase